MPSAPSSAFQLLVILVFLLPGVVFQFARTRLRGPAPDDTTTSTRLLRALTASTLLAIAYVLVLGERASDLLWSATSGNVPNETDTRGLAVWAFILLFAVPVALAILDHLTRGVRPKFWKKLTYDPTPSAWDYTFTDREPTYIRILLSEGRYVGGWFGPNSFVSSYPEPHDVFIEKAYRVDENGVFEDEVEGTGGLWVPADQIVLIELVAPSSDSG